MTSPIKFTDSEGRECELVKQHRDWRYVYTEAPTPADLAACGYVPRAELAKAWDAGARQVFHNCIGEGAGFTAQQCDAAYSKNPYRALAAAEKEEGL